MFTDCANTITTLIVRTKTITGKTPETPGP
jgi:hypothetical protein